jgi:hypothetical protein
MASSAPNKAQAARPAAILTTAEVAGANQDVNETWGAELTVDADFTLGSLTNVILRFYASMDGVTWIPIYAPGSTGHIAMNATLTATGRIAIPVQTPSGFKFFRATAQGTGVVTGSSLTLYYRWLKRGSQG